MANDTNQYSEENNETRIPHPAWLLFACIVVISAWIVNLYYGLTIGTDAGQFGDQFGAANALFSGLALAGLVYAIVMQRFETKVAQETLKTAQDELRNTKQLIDDQKQALDIQNEAAQQQAFESRLFKLLDNYLQIRDGIEKTKNTPFASITETCNSKIFVTYIENYTQDQEYHPLNDNVETTQNLAREYTHKTIKEISDKYIQDFYPEYQEFLGHYFRSLYFLFSFIKQQKLKDKIYYAKLMRSYISDHECFLLLANAYSDYGEKFKSLIIEYDLCNNIPDDFKDNLLYEKYLKDRELYI